MTVTAATTADHGAVIETLAQAFQTDPALSWIVPDEQRRIAALRGLFRYLRSERLVAADPTELLDSPKKRPGLPVVPRGSWRPADQAPHR